MLDKHDLVAALQSQTAGLACATIDAGAHYVAVRARLTGEAGGDARQGLTPARRSILTALDTLKRTFALGKARPSALDTIGDGVVDLIQHPLHGPSRLPCPTEFLRVSVRMGLAQPHPSVAGR